MDEGHPAVVKLISRVIKICRKYGVYTSLCGQAGSRPDYAELIGKAWYRFYIGKCRCNRSSKRDSNKDGEKAFIR